MYLIKKAHAILVIFYVYPGYIISF